MWAARNSPQAEAIHNTHGTIESCQLIGDEWVVTTRGDTGSQIGYLDCSPTDATCMNGWDAKNLTAFTWENPPPAVTFLQIVWVRGDTLTAVTNDGQWTYNLDTATWTRMPCNGCDEAP